MLLDYDNIPEILEFDVDAFIYENQAITPYTMRYMHKILQPQYVLIPNIRIDHTEGLGLDLAEMTRSFADNYRMMKNKKTSIMSNLSGKYTTLSILFLNDTKRNTLI